MKQETDNQIIDNTDSVTEVTNTNEIPNNNEVQQTNELMTTELSTPVEVENEEIFLSMPYSYNQYEYRMYGMMKNVEAFSFINVLLLIVLILVIARRKKSN